MLKRYGDHAEAESARLADELWDDGDMAGVGVWQRIIDAVGQHTDAPASPNRQRDIRSGYKSRLDLGRCVILRGR